MKEKEGRIATLQAAANSHFRAGEREEALKLFTEAIALCDAPPKLPVPIQIYSNRSAVFALLTRYEEALQDADATVQLNPTWARGHSRRGNALHALCRDGANRWDDARMAYERALELEPGNEVVKKALAAHIELTAK